MILANILKRSFPLCFPLSPPHFFLVHNSSLNIFVGKSVSTHQEKNKRGGFIICEAFYLGFLCYFE